MNTCENAFPIALVVSRFNAEMTAALREGALARLRERGFSSSQITLVEVPGAVEIPLVVQRLAKRKNYGAILALGVIIRGETGHYDAVCQQVSQGCQRVALDHDVPVIFEVLMTENEQQVWDRLGGKEGHKGAEAVDIACAMYDILQQLN